MKFFRYFFVSLLAIFSLFASLIIFFTVFNISTAFLVKPVLNHYVPNLKIQYSYLGWDRDGKAIVMVLQDIQYKDDKTLLNINLSRLGVNISVLKTISNKKPYFDLLSFHGLKIFLEEYENGDIVFTFPETIKTYRENQTGDSEVKNIESLQNKISSDTIVDDNYSAKIQAISKELDRGSLGKQSVIESILGNIEILQNTKQVIVANSSLEYETYKSKDKTILVYFDNISFVNQDNEIVIKSDLEIPFGDTSALFSLNSTLDREDNLKFEAVLGDLMIEDLKNYFYLLPEGLIEPSLADKLVAANILTTIEVEGFYQIKERKLEYVSANVKMQNGRFNFDGFFDKGLLVNKLSSSLKYNGETSILLVDKLELELEKGRNIVIPSIKGNWDAQLITLKADIDFNNHIKLQDIKIKTQNNIINGNFSYLLNTKNQIDFNIKAANIKFNDVLRYWPDIETEGLQQYLDTAVANNPTVKSFTMGYSYNIDKDTITYNGQGKIDNVSYNYIQGMPSLKAKQVELEFSDSNVLVSYKEGNIKDIFLAYGFVKLFGKKDPYVFDTVVVDTTLEGALPSILDVISNKALGVESDDINKDSFAGSVLGDLQIEYNYAKEELTNLESSAVISNAVAKNVFANKDFVAKTLDFKIIENTIKLSANGLFDDIVPIKFNGQIGLNSNSKEKAIYSVATTVDLGILRNYKEFDSFSSYLINNISGPAGVVVKYTDYKNQDFDNLNVNVNLLNNMVDYKHLYSKDKGKALKANIGLKIKNNEIFEIDNISIKGDDIDTNFTILFNKSNQIRFKASKIHIKDFYTGNLDLTLREKGFDLNMQGEQLNVAKVKHLNEFIKNTAEEETLESSKAQEPVVENTKEKIEKNNTEEAEKYLILVKINNSYYNERDNNIKKLSINYAYFNNNVQRFLVYGSVNSMQISSAKFSFALIKNEPTVQGQKVNVTIENVGAFFSTLGLYDKILFGAVEDSIFVQKQEKGLNISGNTLVSSFMLNGIPFSEALINFNFLDGVLNLNSVALKGSLLDVSMAGDVNIKEDAISLKGHLAPVANISNLLTVIPIVKNLPLGEGIIKVPISLKGTLEDPKFSFSNK